MIYEFSSHESMLQAWADDPSLVGPSPGGAASMLGITRQGVYQAVKRGSLDMIRLKEPGRPGPFLYITQASLERYKLNQGKPGPRPGWRQRLLHATDATFGNVWPKDR